MSGNKPLPKPSGPRVVEVMLHWIKHLHVVTVMTTDCPLSSCDSPFLDTQISNAMPCICIDVWFKVSVKIMSANLTNCLNLYDICLRWEICTHWVLIYPGALTPVRWQMSVIDILRHPVMQYIPWYMHTVWFCFDLLWLYHYFLYIPVIHESKFFRVVSLTLGQCYDGPTGSERHRKDMCDNNLY